MRTFRVCLWIPPLYLRWTAPPDPVLLHLAASSAATPLSSFPRGLLADGASPPRGWARHRHRARLGRGGAAYARCAAALQRLDCLQLGWLSAATADDSMAICSRQLGGVWLANVNRVLERKTLARSSSVSWGTTVRHVLAGEERLEVRWDEASDEVTFHLRSFSRPRHLFSVVAYPLVLVQQRRFARDAARSLRMAAAAA